MADPQVTTQYQTTIPEYARRYVEDLLGVGAGTVFQYKRDAQNNIIYDQTGMPVIAGIMPYMQYTGDRFAQFTPLQQQAMEAAGKFQVPGQMYDASQIAKQAAERAGTAAYTPASYQAQQVSVDPSRYNAPLMQAAQTGQQFGQQRFTAPGVAQSYMSPYIQNVVDIEKREAQRQADIARQGRGAQFARAGAFGGGRQAIENAEAQRNLAMQMGDIQSRGLQSAYDRAGQMFSSDEARAAQFGIQGALANLSNAQQAAVQNQAAQLQTQGMNASQALQAALANQQASQQAAQLSEQSRQYGAGYGLQGLQTAMTGAGQLGGIGQNIYGQYMGGIGLQSQLGGQQQTQVQNMLNANYQDFLNAQNQPYKNLGFMSDMLRGTQGLGQSTIYQYQQPQSTIGQLAGLGTAAAGFGRLFAEGGSVTSDEAVESYLDDLSDQQLAQARQVAMAKQDMARLQLIEQELAQRASLRRGMGSAFNALPEQTQQRVVSAAEGGVMRFSNGGMDPMGMGVAEITEAAGTAPAYTGPSLLERIVGYEAPESQRRQQAALPPAAQAPAAPARPAAPPPRFEQADLRRLEAVIAKPEPKLTRSEKSAATKVATAVASQTQGNRSDLISDYQRLFAQFKNEDNEALKGIRDAIGKMNKLPEYDRNDAMVKFGLAMAQAASRPGANLLSSISAAAPEIVAHKEKYETEKRAMDRLNAQLQIEQAKYEMALRKDDRTAAMNIAGKMQDIQLQQDRLASEERRHRESMGRSQTGIMGIYEQLRKDQPEASNEALLRKAAEIQNTGVSMRTEAGQSVKLAEGLRKIDEQFKYLPALKAGSPNSPMVAQMETKRQQMIRDLYNTLGGGQPSGVTSPPAQSYAGFRITDVQPSR
jgi:hypothetical protein